MLDEEVYMAIFDYSTKEFVSHVQLVENTEDPRKVVNASNFLRAT
jgi:hypothetical protein